MQVRYSANYYPSHINFVNSIMMTFRISIHCLSYSNISTFRILFIYQEAKTLLNFFSILQHYVAAGTDLAGGVGGATPPPPIFLCLSVNFVSFGKNHLLVVSSNKVTPKFTFFIFLSVFFF